MKKWNEILSTPQYLEWSCNVKQKLLKSVRLVDVPEITFRENSSTSFYTFEDFNWIPIIDNLKVVFTERSFEKNIYCIWPMNKMFEADLIYH